MILSRLWPQTRGIQIIEAEMGDTTQADIGVEEMADIEDEEELLTDTNGRLII